MIYYVKISPDSIVMESVLQIENELFNTHHEIVQ